MSKTSSSLIIVILVLGLIALFRHHSPRPKATSVVPTQSPAALNTGSVAQLPPNTAVAPTKAPPGRPASNEQLVSLGQMTKTLFEFARPDRTLKDLISYLELSHQEPVVAKDHNDYTGDLMIVSTRAPLNGTRYFHAQYFTDEHGDPFVQHMSFEFKPGPESMNEAIRAVQTAFSNLGPPSSKRGDFMQWDMPNGYVVWIKKLDKKDLEDNPFNAYGPEDIGAIRVAVELNPEAD